MGPRTSRVLAIVGATAVLAAGANAVSVAATGDNLIAGKSNKAKKVTKIKRTAPGPALRLKTKTSSSAPFTTNAKGKVVNLNADKLDGQDPTDIRKGLADVKAIRFKDPQGSRTGNTAYKLGELPKGTYLATFNASVITSTAGTAGAPVTMACYLQETPTGIGGDVMAQSTVVTVGSYNTAPSFSNVVTLDGTEDLQLQCGTSTNDGWSLSSLFFFFGESPTITFTKLDGISDRSMTP